MAIIGTKMNITEQIMILSTFQMQDIVKEVALIGVSGSLSLTTSTFGLATAAEPCSHWKGNEYSSNKLGQDFPSDVLSHQESLIHMTHFTYYASRLGVRGFKRTKQTTPGYTTDLIVETLGGVYPQSILIPKFSHMKKFRDIFLFVVIVHTECRYRIKL